MMDRVVIVRAGGRAQNYILSLHITTLKCRPKHNLTLLPVMNRTSPRVAVFN